MKTFKISACLSVLLLCSSGLTLIFAADGTAPASRLATRPVPALQIVPQPYDQAAFTRDGVEVARYHFGKSLNRPFVFPLVGPAGRSLTRMGHPRDPESHSHHNSVWVSHNDVNGVSFWGDNPKGGRIVHQRIDAYEDEGGDLAAVRSTNHWISSADNKVLLVEHRRTQLQTLPGNELLLVIDLQLETPAKSEADVMLGKTPFGMIGVRMAKTIGANDGGGTIRNSEGGVGEKQIFWKPAKWCDYSGPITDRAVEGITLMDHPSNPNHPAGFHVRSDGWMGASLTLSEPRLIQPGKPLKLRYGLYVHNGMPSVAELTKEWEAFAKTPPADLTAGTK
jgi:hypothetical protein